MTHHIQSVKEVAQDYIKKIRSSKDILYKTTCSFCTKAANQFGFLDERNFVPIQGKKFEGKQAVALYGDCCLNDAKRVNDIKSAFVFEGDAPRQIPLHDLEDDNEPHVEAEEIEEDKADGLEEVKEEKKKGLFV